MASVTVNLTGFGSSVSQVQWTDAVVLGSLFSASGASQTLSVVLIAISIQPGRISLSLAGFNNRFTSEFESIGRFIFTASDGATVEVVGVGGDMSEPYAWIPVNSAEVLAFAQHVIGLTDQDATLTLTDDTDTDAPVFADNTGNAQSWTQNIAIATITVPAANGNPTPTYEVVGTPPAGIVFNTTTRVISGTPTVAGSGTIRIRASNSVDTADWTVAYTVALSTAEPVFADDTGNDQTWAAGTPITITVPAATGTPAPTYAAVGTLPTGISFNTGTRVISGTPETVASGTIRIRATNSQGSDDWTVAYTITGPTLPAHGTIHWFVGFTMNDLLQPGTGSGTLAYGLEDLPASLSFGSTSRRITGTPLIAEVGTRELNYTVEDQYGNVASRTFDLQIAHFNEDGLEIAVKILITVEEGTFNQGRFVWRDSTHPSGALGVAEVGSDISLTDEQNVTRIAAFDIDNDVPTTMRFWNQPATASIEDWVNDNPTYTMRVQSTTEGPYVLTHHSGGTNFNSWQTADAATQNFVAALRTGHRFIFALAGTAPVVTEHAHDAGDAAWAFALPQPTIADPLRIDDWVQTGYRNPVILVLLEGDISGDRVTANPASAALANQGDLSVDGANLIIGYLERFSAGATARLERASGDALHDVFSDSGSPMYPNAVLFIQTTDDGVSLYETGSAGFNFANFGLRTGESADPLNDIITGTRFLLAIAEPVEDLTVDAGNVAFAFALPEPAISRSRARDAGNVAWAFAASQPSVTSGSSESVDAGDIAWAFVIPQPAITHTVTHAVNAGDVSWAFTVAEPTGTRAHSYTVDAGDTAFTFAVPEPTVTKTSSHLVDAGNVDFTFAIPQPTVTAGGTAYINAGDAAWAFAVPQPSTSGQTLSLSDFDDTGLDVETAALLLASAPGTASQNFYVDVSRGGSATGTPIEGELGVGPGETVIDRLRRASTENLTLNDSNSPATLDFNTYFGTSGDGRDLTVYLQTTLAGLVSFTVAGAFLNAGGNWLNLTLPAAGRSLLDNLASGDRFIFALARPAADDHTVDVGDVSWAFAVAEPTVTRVHIHTVDAGDAAFSFAIPAPTIQRGRARDAGAVSWVFALPQPTIFTAGSHFIGAGDVAFAFYVPQPSVVVDHAVNAGDMLWAFDLPQPTRQRGRARDAGNVGFAFAVPQPTVFTAGSHFVDAGDVDWIFAVDQPSAARGVHADAGDVSFVFAVPQPTIFTAGSHFADAGDAAFAFAVAQPTIQRGRDRGAGDVAFAFALPQPSVVVSHTVNAGDVEYTYAVPEPTVTRTQEQASFTIPLGNVNLADWIGAILIPPRYIAGGGVAYLVRVGWGGGQGIAIDLSATTDVLLFTPGPEFTFAVESNEVAFEFHSSNGTSIIVPGPTAPDTVTSDPTEPYYWEPANNAAWLDWWFDARGTNLTLTINDSEAFANFVDAGDVSFAFAVPDPTVAVARTIDADDANFTFDVPSASVAISRSYVVDAGDATWVFTLLQPSTSTISTHLVNVGDVAFSFVLPEPGRTLAHFRDAGDVAWAFAAPQSVTHVVARTVDAGDAAWAFSVTPALVDIARFLPVNPGAARWQFNVPELRIARFPALPMLAAPIRVADRIIALDDRIALLISQWTGSAPMLALLRGMYGLIDTEFVQALQDLETMRNWDTAEGVWLDYIGRRLGFLRPTIDAMGVRITRFGFDGGDGVGFNQAPFATVSGFIPQVPVPDAVYLLCLKVWAGTILTSGSVLDMNTAVRRSFPAAYYTDGADSTIALVSRASGTQQTTARDILTRLDAWPRPAGVGLTVT